MFPTAVRSTPFAEYGFPNITGATYCDDVSFVSTLRALFAPRLKDDEKITLNVVVSSLYAHTISPYTNNRGPVIDAMHAFDRPKNSITICNLSGTDVAQNLDFVEKAMKELPSLACYERLDKISQFYRKSFTVDCYIDRSGKRAVVLVDRLDMRKWHYLQCSVFAMLPWYFDPKQGCTDEEMKLIYSLREGSADNYISTLREMAKSYDFRERKIRELLSGFETIYLRDEYKQIEMDNRGCMQVIDNYNTQIADMLRRMNDNNIRLAGLHAQINSVEESESEMMDYFLCSKSLCLEYLSGRTLTFTAIGYLDMFDEDIAESVIGNPSSIAYKYDGVRYQGNITPAGMRKLLTAVFIDKTIKIRVCARYEMTIGERLSPVSGVNFEDYPDYLPNPHINNYACMGNHTSIVNSLMRDGNYIGAIEQCIASCRNINWSDYTVMHAFMNALYNTACKRCIELPDGKTVTPGEAIVWLNEQAKENEEENVDE